MNNKITTRFAPSPTGYLHIGGARTALFSWLYAKKNKGDFILRVEDTDLSRSSDEAVKAILDGMSWLGLTHDKEVYYQTKRFDRYNEVIETMLKNGTAYRCYCSKERLESLRETQLANKEKTSYDGKCRENDIDINKKHVIRFKNPIDGFVSWKDDVKGEIIFQNEQLDDLIIRRTDGSPTYNFCVVVDDIDMNITHVVRGDDHVNNTPRQINIYKALDKKIPEFAHLPMLLGEDGKKLSKRHGAVGVMEFRNAGYLPEAILNYLVRLGWSHGDKEIFSIDEMINLFDLKDVNLADSAFNMSKLDWLNQHYIKTLPLDYISQELKWHFEQQGVDTTYGPVLSEIIKVMAEKTKTLKEMAEKSKYFYEDFKYYDEKSSKKHLKATVISPLKLVYKKLNDLNSNQWQDETILHQTLVDTASDLELGMGKVGMPVRVAISGGGQSPDIGVTLKLIGREKSLARIENAISFVS